jgi:hypothetical protein
VTMRHNSNGVMKPRGANTASAATTHAPCHTNPPTRVYTPQTRAYVTIHDASHTSRRNIHEGPHTMTQGGRAGSQQSTRTLASSLHTHRVSSSHKGDETTVEIPHPETESQFRLRSVSTYTQSNTILMFRPAFSIAVGKSPFGAFPHSQGGRLLRVPRRFSVTAVPPLGARPIMPLRPSLSLHSRSAAHSLRPLMRSAPAVLHE